MFDFELCNPARAVFGIGRFAASDEEF